MHVLKSKYCMSENMGQGAITEVANYLFDQKEHDKWKPYKSGEAYDSSTLPSLSNANGTEPDIKS